MRWCLSQGFWREDISELTIVIGPGVGIRKGFMEKVEPVTTALGSGTMMGKIWTHWILDI